MKGKATADGSGERPLGRDPITLKLTTQPLAHVNEKIGKNKMMQRGQFTQRYYVSFLNINRFSQSVDVEN